MDWKELLSEEIKHTYGVAAHLLDLVEPDMLTWKPSEENNWLTVGQLILHLTEACGVNVKGFVTGVWDYQQSASQQDRLHTDLPSAQEFPEAKDIEQVKQLLLDDYQMTLNLLDSCSEYDLSKKKVSAPWDPQEVILGYRILQMVDHLKQHKGQLFYYLKLQGKPVNTLDLWGLFNEIESK